MHEPLIYWVDDEDRIVEVSPSWDEAARDNGGVAVLSTLVLGKRLWTFITGDASRMLVAALLASARTLGREAVQTTYRCDTPDRRRTMQMRVVREGDGRVRVEHRLLEAEPVAPAVHFVGSREPGAGLLLRCSMCNRIHLEERWVEPSDAVAEGAMPPRARVAYSVCPPCFARVRRGL